MVRAYLQTIARMATIPGATEHTYRAALGEFLTKAVGSSASGQLRSAASCHSRMSVSQRADRPVLDAGIGKGRPQRIRPELGSMLAPW